MPDALKLAFIIGCLYLVYRMGYRDGIGAAVRCDGGMPEGAK